MGKTDDRADRRVIGLVEQGADNGSVDLDLADRKALEVLERAEAGGEPVEDECASSRREPIEGRARALDIVADRPLSDLESDRALVDA